MDNNSKVHIKAHRRSSRHYVDYMSDLWLDGLCFDLNDPMLDDARDSGEY